MGGSCSCHHQLKSVQKRRFWLSPLGGFGGKKKRFKFVTLSGLAAGRTEGLCVSPEKQCSHAAYFTQYPRRTDIYKEKDLFSFFKNRKKEEILLFCKGSPPPVLFTFIGSSKEQVQPRLSPPGTQRAEVDSAVSYLLSCSLENKSTASVIQEQMSISDEHFPPWTPPRLSPPPSPALFMKEIPLICQSSF